MKFWRPILLLCVSAPMLTELATNNVPAPRFFQPSVFLLLATLGYGLPILILRELAVRWRLSIAGHVTLGLAYGIYNEGLLARTLLHGTGVPVPAFDHYGFFDGINFSWAVVTVVWHAYFAFLFPLLLTSAIFPGAARQTWLDKWSFRLIAVAIGVVASLAFFRRNPPEAGASLRCYLGLIGAMAISIGGARFLVEPADRDRREAGILSACLGGVGLMMASIFLPTWLAHFHANLFIYFFIVLVAGAGVLGLLQKKFSAPPALWVFGLGAELAMAGFCLAGAFGRGSLVGTVTDLVFLGVFAAALLWVARWSSTGRLKETPRYPFRPGPRR